MCLDQCFSCGDTSTSKEVAINYPTTLATTKVVPKDLTDSRYVEGSHKINLRCPQKQMLFSVCCDGERVFLVFHSWEGQNWSQRYLASADQW